MQFDVWQKEALEHDGNLLLCTGRQVGKTTIMAAKAAEFILNHKGSQIIVVSLTEDQAKLIIVMILDYLEKKNKKVIAKGKNKPTQNKITLTNHSKVIARPVGTTGDAVRGFTGDVLIIDEASRMPQLVWDAGKPTLLTTGGQIWMCSTPFGKQGYFWEAFQNKDGRFKVIHVSSEEVIMNREICDGWTEDKRTKAIKFLEDEKTTSSKLQYGQEYLGLFIDDLQRYFSDELIKACCILRREEQIDKNANYYMGVDIARMGEDESSFEILRKVRDRELIQVENQTTTKTLTTETEDRIISLNNVYDFQKIYLDAGSGSLGVGIFDHLLRVDSVKRKVVAINNSVRPLDFSGDTKAHLLKEDLYDNLRSLMEKGFIKLLDDEKVIASLRSIQYEFLKKENEQTKLHIFGSYSHIVEGLIRAAWCSKEKDLRFWVTSIRV